MDLLKIAVDRSSLDELGMGNPQHLRSGESGDEPFRPGKADGVASRITSPFRPL